MWTISQSLRWLFYLQLGIGAIFIVGAFSLGLQLGASTAAGVVLMTLNTALLAWVWGRLLTQKTIAWTMLVIVIKYAVLLGSTYYFTQLEWFRPLGFGVGISSFVMAALALAVIHQCREQNIEVNLEAKSF